MRFVPDQNYEKFLNEYKKLGYATKAALINDALRLDVPQKSGQRNFYAAFATLSSSNFVGLT